MYSVIYRRFPSANTKLLCAASGRKVLLLPIVLVAISVRTRVTVLLPLTANCIAHWSRGRGVRGSARPVTKKPVDYQLWATVGREDATVQVTLRVGLPLFIMPSVSTGLQATPSPPRRRCKDNFQNGRQAVCRALRRGCPSSDFLTTSQNGPVLETARVVPCSL